ncbi:MAG: GntR family transcriptional regulator, transcriptional repressor for pyruvate dehydrogenase complex [Gaiellaceae bacterium]|nr:GntR family transcriptional regulator, transcriptional repressor for pyruvate dehydrogenase complex [Gaiellaceae bacterium]
MALTDEAIEKIKALIVAGEFAPGSRLPRERELADRLGLSRSSLREAVRALTLVGVLETRQGDGTYVTSLDADLLLASTAFVSELASGPSMLELFQVRRILEPAVTALAAARISDEQLDELDRCLEHMAEAQGTEAFVAADESFHKVIRDACGNAMLSSLLSVLSGGTVAARIWRGVSEEGSLESTLGLHRDIASALRARDAELAAAADLVHLGEGERWLRDVLAADDSPAAEALRRSG